MNTRAEGTTIPPFKKITRGVLVALDTAEQLDTIEWIHYINKAGEDTALHILYVGSEYVFGYIPVLGGKQYFYRRICRANLRHYFVFDAHRHYIPDTVVRKGK